MGIRRVAAQVQHHLVSSGLYTVIPVEMDPADLGEPVRRPRLYFLGVRKDVALAESAVLTRIVECAWHFVKQQSSVHSPKSNALLRRLLPASHPAVEQHQKLRKERWLQAGSAQTPTGPFIWISVTVSILWVRSIFQTLSLLSAMKQHGVLTTWIWFKSLTGQESWIYCWQRAC